MKKNLKHNKIKSWHSKFYHIPKSTNRQAETEEGEEYKWNPYVTLA